MAWAFPHSSEAADSFPLMPVNCGINHHQEPVDRPLGYPVWQWIQVLEGEGLYTDSSGSTTVRRGDVLFLHPHWPHRYRALSGSWIVHWVAFGGSAVRPCIEHSPFVGKSGPFSLSDPEHSAGIIASIFSECLLASPSSDIRAGSLLYSLLASAFLSFNPASAKGPLRLRSVMEYVESHLVEDITLSSLAFRAGLSPQHLSRLFRAQYGKSPIAWLEILRMRAAKSLLLEHPEFRIKEVAGRVGFRDQNLFARRFRALEGISPREFRQLHGY